jgi:mannosidase alpha-like ER degradation enhancer 1
MQLSAHILASDSQYGYTIEGYNGELLRAAKDLAQRLVPAFQMSRTGIPYPRVSSLTEEGIGRKYFLMCGCNR